LSQLRSQAEIQFLEDGNYNHVCDTGTQGGNLFEEASLISKNVSPLANPCMDENGRVVIYGESSTPLTPSTTSSGIDANGNIWAAAAKLNGDGWFCVDSSGTTKITSSRTINHNITPGDKTC
tara:strand:+ start:185 stop:550 length:366 start_codon:yes stop_codon:yes gene_type:complete